MQEVAKGVAQCGRKSFARDEEQDRLDLESKVQNGKGQFSPWQVCTSECLNCQGKPKDNDSVNDS